MDKSSGIKSTTKRPRIKPRHVSDGSRVSAVNALLDTINVVSDKNFLSNSDRLEVQLAKFRALLRPAQKIEVYTRKMLSAIVAQLSLLNQHKP